MHLGSSWRPNQIIRVVKPLTNSTKPLLVETDQGDAIMKSIGNPAGTEA